MRVRIGLMGFALVFRGNEWAKSEWVMLSFNVPSANLLIDQLTLDQSPSNIINNVGAEGFEPPTPSV